MQFQRAGSDEKARFSLSVRELVEFLRRDGGLDDRVSARAEQEAMLKGAKLHRKLQSAAGPGYQSEVPLSGTLEYENYKIIIDEEPMVYFMMLRIRRRKVRSAGSTK